MVKRILVAGIGVVVVAFGLTACGSSGSKSTAPPASSPDTFVLSEFTITVPTTALHAGRVKVETKNAGGEVHELVIVRANSVSDLPMMSDGSVNEDKISEADKVGEIAGIAAGARGSKTFLLTAGTYVAFCNLVDSMHGQSDMGGMGHVHFAEGMHATFTVS